MDRWVDRLIDMQKDRDDDRDWAAKEINLQIKIFLVIHCNIQAHSRGLLWAPPPFPLTLGLPALPP